MNKLLPTIAVVLLGISTCRGAERARTVTLQQAREIASQRHPKITIAELKALAAKQVVKQIQAARLPYASANFGGVVSAEEDTRIVSPSLPVSSVFNRASGSLNVSQLITDFGRTSHLTESSKLKAGADERNIEATRAQVLLQVDGAYMGALQAGSLLSVAEETVRTRQLARDQIATLAENKLRSELDVSFADVNLQDANLLLSRSKNDLQSAYAALAALLDEPQTSSFNLVEVSLPTSLLSNLTDLISLALNNRPDLQKLRLELASSVEFAKAETALNRPTLSVQGAAGVIPWRDKSLNPDYAAAGVILSWPIFTGGLNTARRKEAELRAQIAVSTLHDEENLVVRDVRTAWFGVINALERTIIAGKLLEQARKTHALAEARYKSGTSSMVELGQAQLNLTSAEINETNAKYEYLIRRSVLDYHTGVLKPSSKK